MRSNTDSLRKVSNTKPKDLNVVGVGTNKRLFKLYSNDSNNNNFNINSVHKFTSKAKVVASKKITERHCQASTGIVKVRSREVVKSKHQAVLPQVRFNGTRDKQFPFLVEPANNKTRIGWKERILLLGTYAKLEPKKLLGLLNVQQKNVISQTKLRAIRSNYNSQEPSRLQSQIITSSNKNSKVSEKSGGNTNTSTTKWTFDDENESFSAFTSDLNYLETRIPSNSESQSTTTENQYQLSYEGTNGLTSIEKFSSTEEVTIPRYSDTASSEQQSQKREDSFKSKMDVTSNVEINGNISDEFNDSLENSKNTEHADVAKTSLTIEDKTDKKKESKSSIVRSKINPGHLRPVSDMRLTSPKLQNLNKTLESASRTISNTKSGRQSRNNDSNTNNFSSASIKEKIVGLKTSEHSHVVSSPKRIKERQLLLQQGSQNQAFRGEVKRLERTRDDLIRRNTFLQKQIEKAKEELNNIIPDEKINELSLRNDQLHEEELQVNREIQAMKKQLAFYESAIFKANEEHDEVLSKFRGVINERKNLDLTQERQVSQKKKLESDKNALMGKKQSLKQQLDDVIATSQSETNNRTDKENTQKVYQENIMQLKEEVSNADIMLQQIIEERSEAEDAHKKAKDVCAGLKDEIAELDLLKRSLVEDLESLNDNLDVVKKESAEIETLLAQAQENFRKKEEIKMNMINSSSQTTGKLVIMRDIAWIRVAEEEVLLSPHCGAQVEERDNRQSTPKLPVGATTPVFEVYNLAPPDGESISPTKQQKRRIPLQNKRLVEAHPGTEYMWTGDSGE